MRWCMSLQVTCTHPAQDEGSRGLVRDNQKQSVFGYRGTHSCKRETYDNHSPSLSLAVEEMVNEVVIVCDALVRIEEAVLESLLGLSTRVLIGIGKRVMGGMTGNEQPMELQNQRRYL